MNRDIHTRWLIRLCLVLLAARLMSAVAEAQIVRGGGPPTVTITEVRDLGNQCFGGTSPQPPRCFQVLWATQRSQGTRLLRYRVTLQVRFNGNVTQTVAGDVGGAATSIGLNFSDASANARAREFGATVTLTYSDLQTGFDDTTREFDFTTNAFQGGVGSGGQLPPDRPIVQISGAKAIDRSDFEARWNMQAAKDVTVINFRVNGEAIYGSRLNGDLIPIEKRKSEAINAVGSQRRVVLVVKDPPPAIDFVPIRIRIGIETEFTSFPERTVQGTKEGRF